MIDETVDTPDGDHVLSFAPGTPLQADMAAPLLPGGSCGAIVMPDQLVLLKLSDYQDSDDLAFRILPTTVRIMRAQTFLLFSIANRAFNFDIVWSPIIARRTGETMIEKPGDGLHPLFRFVLIDGSGIVRSLRAATLSPSCAVALWRAQQEMISLKVTEAEQNAEMIELFSKFPNGIPDTVFHETCLLGD